MDYQNEMKETTLLSRDERGSSVEIEPHLRRLSWVLDDLIRLPVVGWRIGLDAILGLIPWIGDVATTLVSLYILFSAVRYGVPKVALARMGINIGIDYALGSLPLVGDLFDAAWKSNRRNLRLLQRHLGASTRQRARLSDWLFVISIALALALLAFGSLFVAIYLFDHVVHRLV